MRQLKVDVTKLKTVANYAMSVNRTPTTIYQWEKDGKIEIINIDGIKFVLTEGTK